MTSIDWGQRVLDLARSAAGESVGGAKVAARGAVDLEPEPGCVSGRIERRGDERIAAEVTMPRFTDDERIAWIAAVAANARWSAAILTGSMPLDLASVGPSRPAVLPDPADVGHDCSCGDWARWCEHAGAVVHALAEAGREDPFLLLWVRGVSRDDLIAAIRAHRGSVAPAGVPREPDRGADPAASWARQPAPLPSMGALPWRPARPVDVAAEPPGDSGVSARALRLLAADAGARAVAMLHGLSDGDLGIDLAVDLVRRVAGEAENGGAPDHEAFASMIGWTPTELSAAVDAWRIGGSDAVSALRDRWEPPGSVMEAAVAQLEAVTRVRRSANVLSGPSYQLRVDRRQRWWRFTPHDDLGWVVAAGGFDDVLDAYEAELSPPGSP